MFINLSNHASDNWGEKQKKAAEKYGNIVDIPFPAVEPDGNSAYIDKLVKEYYQQVMKYDNPVVMIQGEFVFTYRLVNRLKEARIRVVASCTERRTVERQLTDGSTEKHSVFEFVQFREY